MSADWIDDMREKYEAEIAQLRERAAKHAQDLAAMSKELAEEKRESRLWEEAAERVKSKLVEAHILEQKIRTELADADEVICDLEELLSAPFYLNLRKDRGALRYHLSESNKTRDALRKEVERLKSDCESYYADEKKLRKELAEAKADIEGYNTMMRSRHGLLGENESLRKRIEELEQADKWRDEMEQYGLGGMIAARKKDEERLSALESAGDDLREEVSATIHRGSIFGGKVKMVKAWDALRAKGEE